MNRMTARTRALLVVMTAWLLLVTAATGQAEAFGSGAQGPDVYAVQGMMKSLGYYPGPIDGKFGPVMAAGVRAFQQKYGLPVTGNVDARTLQSILWAYGELKIPKATPTPTPTPKSPTPGKSGLPALSAEEQEMVNLVNQERQKRGLSALKVDLALARVARIKSQDMVAKNYFSHQSPTYGSPFTMMTNFGITYNSAAENIACNQTVQAAQQAFMNSEGHRANILNPDYDYIGVGIASGGPCGKMFTQQFVGR